MNAMWKADEGDKQNMKGERILLLHIIQVQLVSVFGWSVMHDDEIR